MPMDRRDYFERLIFTSLGNRRFTQRSPILPEVWLAYAKDPARPQDLLLTPHRAAGPGKLAVAVRERLKKERELERRWAKGERKLRRFPSPMARRRAEAGTVPPPARVAYNQFNVVATLHFDELMRVVLPLSHWWREDLARGVHEKFMGGKGEVLDSLMKLFHPGKKDLPKAEAALAALKAALAIGERYQPGKGGLDADLVWMAQAVGTMAFLGAGGDESELPDLDPPASDVVGPPDPTPLWPLADSLFELFRGVAAGHREVPSSLLWNLQLNRRCQSPMFYSTVAIKSDAAQRVFKGSGEGQTWAILDSGIDARHVAFRKRDREEKPLPEAFEVKESKRLGTVLKNHTRIAKTYDFTLVRDLLSDPEGLMEGSDPAVYPNLSEKQRRRLAGLEKRTRQALKRDLARGRMLDWEALEQVIEIPHRDDEYESPVHKHGTHVAGILGADWRSGDSGSDRLSAAPGEEAVRQGVCPQIELYDLRVLDQDGRGDEFSINSALQWVRSINQRTDALVIRGVNLSLAIPHDMANFACGRTPVCEEVERLVGAGVVVVAAAGNRGKTEHRNKKGFWEDAYHSISITDPGNAESAITVGATHKIEPHTYGVSYFSSRGPTGDGRRKPDLVAPGEKIWSTTPGDDAEEMDGTSQAAPHVAGAAALLMQRYPELIGRPHEIKRILCENATDLGREPYFQGAGMLDILRALQSF